MKQFMVVLRGNPQEWKALGPDETQRLMEKYVAWVETLKKNQRFKGGAPLGTESRLLKTNGKTVSITDGPYAETKEALTGYFLIEAENLEGAAETAKGCPALLHGESVEVIPVNL